MYVLSNCIDLSSMHTLRRSRQFQRFFFKHSEFYEISCDISLKPIIHINEIKKWGHQTRTLFIEHFLSIPTSVTGVLLV